MKAFFKFSNLKRFSTNTNKKILKNYINGEFVNSESKKHFDIINPSTGETISHVPDSLPQEFNKAVSDAQTAFKTWRNVPLLTRQRYMFEYVRLLKQNQVNYFFIKLGKIG